MSSLLLQIIILAVINVVAIMLGFWVVWSDKNDAQNRLFALMSLAIILWVDFSFAGSSVSDIVSSSIFYKLNLASVSLTLLAFYYFFVVYFLQQKSKHKVLNSLVVFLSMLVAGIALFTNGFNNGVVVRSWGMEAVEGNLINVFNVFALVISFIFIYFGIKSYSSLGIKERQKIKYFFVGILLFIIANIIFNIVVPILFKTSEYQHFGDFSAIIFLGFTAYAIVRNHLFDVKFAIIRSVTYALVLATLAVIYLVIVLLMSMLFNRESSNTWEIVTNVIISIFLAFLIQPLKRFFDKITNKIFYKDRYHTDEFYTRLNDALTLNTNLRGILKRASYEIAKTLKCNQVFFFINTIDGHFVSEGTPHHKQLTKNEAEKISEYCGNDYHAIAASILEPKNPLQELIQSHGIEIVLPLTQGDKIVGYLCLGNNMASGYTARDIKVLNMVADEMVIAVQNAIAVQKILELNSTLKQRVATATKELRTKNAQLRQLDKAKDEFVSVAAHELRTPMTVFRGFISMLMTKQLGNVNRKQQELLDKMSNNTKTLIDLVNNMLDLSKLEADRLVINLSDNFVGDMVNRSIDKITLLYEGKGLALNYTNVSVRVKTDPEKFERVLVNLLSNAYKFTPTGGVTISAKVNEKNRMVTVCVADTGTGIPPESINKLFKKFSQVDNYLQKTSSGTGLGLAICKQMVEKMGGEIWVESQPEKGSQFYFTMPMSEALVE